MRIAGSGRPWTKVVLDWAEAKIKQGCRVKPTRRRVLDIQRFLTRDAPALAKRSLLDLSKSKSDIKQYLIKQRSPAMANRIHTILSSIFKWADEEELYGLKDGVNPCNSISYKSYGYQRARNTKLIEDEQLRALWLAGGEQGYPWGPFLRFMLLVPARHGETMLMEWPEVKDGIWTAPAAHTKCNIENRRPLSIEALEIFHSLPRDIESAVALIPENPHPYRANFRRQYSASHVWGLKPLDTYAGCDGSNRDPKQVLNKHVPEEFRDWTFHRIRHTFKTCMAKNHRHVHPEAVELYLGHEKKKDLDWQYNHYKYEAEMKEVADLWAREVMRIVNPPPPNVIRLKRA
jgi:integrase